MTASDIHCVLSGDGVELPRGASLAPPTPFRGGLRGELSLVNAGATSALPYRSLHSGNGIETHNSQCSTGVISDTMLC